MAATTRREFEYSKDDFFQIVDNWAKENSFKLKEEGNNFRIYKKGSYFSFFFAHPEVYVEMKNGKVVLESWICPSWGGKMDISSENYMGFAAKSAARKPINKLLAKFDQSPIL